MPDDPFEGDSARARDDAVEKRKLIGKYYVNSSSEKGVRDWLKFSVPPSINALLGKIWDSGAIPAYRNKTDIMRDAEVKGLYFIQWEIDNPDIEHKYDVFAADCEIDLVVARNAYADGVVEKLRGQLQIAKSDSERQELVDIGIKMLAGEQFQKSESRTGDLKNMLRGFGGQV